MIPTPHVPYKMLREHYEILKEALHDIVDTVWTQDFKCETVEDCVKLLHSIATMASHANQIDLFNPHNQPGAAEEVLAELKVQFRLAPPSRLSEPGI